MSRKKAAVPAWKKIALKTFRYLFFAGYLVLMVSVLYGASFFYAPAVSIKSSGEKQ